MARSCAPSTDIPLAAHRCGGSPDRLSSVLPVPSDAWTVPNVLCYLRLLAVPVFVSLHLGSRPGWALVVFVAAALTDSLDGFLARLLDQRTRLGAFLDPLADKVLTGAALIMLFLEDEAPLWMVLLVAFRDGAIALGAVVVKRKGLELPAAPSRVGKYATFALTCYILLGLLDETFTDSPLLHAWLLVAGYFTGLCVAISTTQYFLRWGHLWVAPARRAP